MPKSDTKKLVLESKFEEMERLESYIDELQSWIGFDEEDSGRIMLTLSEAVNNAIIHGNNEDPEKKVIVKSQLNQDNQMLVISVEDEGDGFDLDEIPDPLKDENLLNEGGRGVYLIEQYADDLEFSEGGKKAIVRFKLSS